MQTTTQTEQTVLESHIENTENVFNAKRMTAFIPFINYIRRMILPLQENGSNVCIPAKIYNINEIKSKNYRGVTGVAVSNQENTAIADTELFTRKKGVLDWYIISIPESEMFLDLSKDIENQSDYVKSNIFNKHSLDVLYKNEASLILKRVDDFVKDYPQEQRAGQAAYELNEYYRLKKEEILNLRNVQEYINFLNEKGNGHDSNMTSSYLYTICNLKGLHYEDITGEHFLLFNAKDDITITEMRHIDMNE